ncbi:MAG: DDE-type integrase/transposase/recombinase [Myxacorys californica WJT36-NPBG1]|jgi:hypothetical protein|nr:DDE-type integrase/transposase/recombinase [Myxacorys californica WJT36-NPBG1]
MLDAKSFDNWCQSLGVSQTTRAVIEGVRNSAPSRRVQSRRGNVVGNYPSHKMGFTIQFESHRNELARIYELEHDSNVLEYYDQPIPIELDYLSKNGRRNRHPYTPDFFIIRKDSAGWEECKTEQELIKLIEDSPNRYQQDEQSQWHCPPAETYAARYGLFFKVRSDSEINWIFQQNFAWLEDYFHLDSSELSEEAVQNLLKQVSDEEGITLAELLRQANPDDIYTLIATDSLYVDLHAARLAEPDRVQVFSDQATAFAYQRATEVALSLPNHSQIISITVGASLVWDGECWEVVNTGSTTTGLLRADNQFVELPNGTVESLIQQGKITALTETEDTTRQDKIQEILRRAKPGDIAEANRRYEQIQPYLNPDAPPTPSSTIRRWRIQYRQAEAAYGSGYVGLLPINYAKGNRTSKLGEPVREFMIKFIKENYETLKHRRRWRVYESLVAACEAHQPKLTPPSSTTFYKEIKRRSGMEQTAKREGRRAAIQERPTYLQLELTTPRHGDRPFEIIHIDHTEIDVELAISLTSLTQCNFNSGNSGLPNLGRPWATFMVDAYSRRLLAVYLSYEEPSYRSCMSVLRICVQRFKRFPQSIVVDNGPEFHSNYFEQLLAYFACTKKHRPPADARYGFVVERLFGTANTQFVHELRGNTQIKRLHRKVTKSVKPESQAVWTLGELYEAFCHWAYEVYDKRQHPTLGQSPREAFNDGLAIGGSRTCRRVEYDKTFRILTLPAPERGNRKVQPGRGIKINNIYYWSNTFRDPEIEQSKVEVRYEPFDASIAYALVRGQWVECVSDCYQYLQGRSEKEIRLVSAELVKRKRDQGRNVITSDKELVQFLNSVEAKEGKFLEQRLKASENKQVVQAITAVETDCSVDSVVPSSPVTADGLSDREPLLDERLETNEPNSDSSSSNLEFYGEW